MKKTMVALMLMGLAACSSPEVSQQTLQGLQVSGEFLFEGPNTLQGPLGPEIDGMLENMGVDKDNLKAIYLQSAEITFVTDTLRGSVESALVQFVSDELELVSVATKSPLPATDPVVLETTAEQDILPYLLDETSSLVVDVNLTQDMEVLEASVSMVVNVEYRK